MKHNIYMMLILVSGFGFTCEAVAQTPLQGFSPPPTASNGTRYQQGTTSPSVRTSARPTNRTAARTSRLQAEAGGAGNYPVLERLGGGQIQEAWNKSTPDKGVYRASTCKGCVIKVRTREFMVSHVKLPPSEHIKSIDVGDPTAFDVQVRGTQSIAIRPLLFGTDTSIIIQTHSGTTHPLYVRSESYNSQHVPDLVVYLAPWAVADVPKPVLQSGAVVSNRELIPGIPGYTATNSPRQSNDFVKSVPFSVAKLHGWNDYVISGSSKDYKPVRVFRDDYFTYIQWDDWPALELPTAYVTVGGIDEVVNTRLEGETYVIETTAALITLKSGDEFICIRYTRGGRK